MMIHACELPADEMAATEAAHKCQSIMLTSPHGYVVGPDLDNSGKNTPSREAPLIGKGRVTYPRNLHSRAEQPPGRPALADEAERKNLYSSENPRPLRR
jgi:hypothetical protein